MGNCLLASLGFTIRQTRFFFGVADYISGWCVRSTCQPAEWDFMQGIPQLRNLPALLFSVREWFYFAMAIFRVWVSSIPSSSYIRNCRFVADKISTATRVFVNRGVNLSSGFVAWMVAKVVGHRHPSFVGLVTLSSSIIVSTSYSLSSMFNILQ